MSQALNFVIALQQAYLECIANIGKPKCLVLSQQAMLLLKQWGMEMNPTSKTPIGIRRWNGIPVGLNQRKIDISFAFFT